MKSSGRGASTCRRSAGACPRRQVDACGDDERLAEARTDRLRKALVGGGPLRELDAHGKRRILLHARPLRDEEDAAGDARGEGCDDLADRGGKTFTPRTISMSLVRPTQRFRGLVRPQRRAGTHFDVVARPEAEQRRGAVAEVREHELAGAAVAERRARRSRGRAARRGRSRARPGACRLARRTPPRATRRCPRSPSPRHVAPQLLERRAEGRLASSGLARDDDPLDARGREGDAALGGPLHEVCGVRRRQHRGLRTNSSIARTSRRCPRYRRGPGTGRCGRTRPGRRLRRRARRCRSRRSAGRPSHRRRRSCAPSPRSSSQDRPRSAGCSSACRSFRSSSRSGRSRRASRRGGVPIGSSGETVSRSSCFSVSGSCASSASPPASFAVSMPAAASFCSVGGWTGRGGGSKLSSVLSVVERELLVPGTSLDVGLEHHPEASPGGSYAIASSACAAIRKPIGLHAAPPRGARGARPCGRGSGSP